MERIAQYYRFIQEAEQLKSVCRTAWTAKGRRESTAEHSWRMALLAALFLQEYRELDGNRVLIMCLIHDLGELYDGDISAASLPDEEEKYQSEERAVRQVLSLLPEDLEQEWYGIWKEYNDNVTPEARLVKALDKAETIIQHNQGRNPENFDYEFNLQYGASYFKGDERLETLRRLADAETEAHISGRRAPNEAL